MCTISRSTLCEVISAMIKALKEMSEIVLELLQLACLITKGIFKCVALMTTVIDATIRSLTLLNTAVTYLIKRVIIPLFTTALSLPKAVCCLMRLSKQHNVEEWELMDDGESDGESDDGWVIVNSRARAITAG